MTAAVDPLSPPPSTLAAVLHPPDASARGDELRRMRPHAAAPPICVGPAGLGGTVRTRGDVTVVADARLDDRARLCDELGVDAEDPAAPDDVELVLRAYERWGEECAGRLVGAFALVVWDARAGCLFAARDHMGFRPLHWSSGPAGLVLASWAEAVLAHPGVVRAPDPKYAEDQVERRPGGERSPFLGISRLLPGGTLSARPGEVPRLGRHWSPRPHSDFASWTPERCVVALRCAVRAAVADAVRDAEPTGAHLSGGVDSSTIAVLADQELRRVGGRLARAYSWSPPEDQLARVGGDERERVERIAVAIGVPVTYRRDHGERARVVAMRAELQPIEMQAMEGPVLRDAAARGLRVLVSGWGGDEVASANGRGWLAGLLAAGHPHQALRDAWTMAVGHGAHGPRRVTGTIGFLWREGLVPLVPRRVWSAAGGGGRPSVGVHATQVDLLERGHVTRRIESWAWSGDRVGVTYRYPLLDRRVLDLCLGLPEGLWWHAGQRRWLFRRVADGILPVGIASEAVKNEPALWQRSGQPTA